MKITTNQLYRLLMVLADISQKELADRLEIDKSSMNYWMTAEANFQFIKKAFKACEIPFVVLYNNQKVHGFSISDLSQNIKVLALSTELPYSKLRRSFKNDKMKIKDLKQIFKSKGQEFNLLINNSKYTLK